ncbi:MAG TPA: PAS domain S-box protein, partial [Pyrinomonadaceae bacterium]|nr:PAS domain S-box protein [Pyrinomonadaceae bacterium]
MAQKKDKDLVEVVHADVSASAKEGMGPSAPSVTALTAPPDGFYRDLIENANDIIYSHDLAGNYLSLNNAAEKLFGYTRDELLEMNMQQIVDPSSLELVREMISKKISGEVSKTSYEVECIAKAGHKITLEVVTSLFYKDGQPIAVEGIARDITDRKRTEAALLEAHSALRAVFAAMNDVILVLDADGRCLKVEETNAPEQFRPPVDLVGRTLDHLLPREEADRIVSAIRRSLETRESVELDYKTTILGKNYWLVGIISPMLENTVVFVSGDITQRKSAEAALRKSEADLNTAQKIARLGSWERLYANPDTSLDTDSFVWSDEFYRIFGFEPQEFPPSLEALYDAIHPEDREMVQSTLTQALNKQLPFEIRHRVLLPNGEKRFVFARGETTFDPMDGRAIKTFGTVQDITDYVLAAEARYRSEQRFRELVENANDIIYTHDLEGNFTSLNKAGERITGYSRYEAFQKNIADVVAPEYLDIARTMLASKTAGDKPTVYELEVISKDGRRITLEVSTTLLYLEDAPVGVQGIARDVTERKAAEAALLYSETNLAIAQRIGRVGSWDLEFYDTTDLTNNRLRWSDEMFRIFGHEPGEFEVTRTSFYDRVHPEDREYVQQKVAEAVATRSRLEIEGRIIHKNGSVRLVQAQAEGFYDESTGLPARMLGTTRDVTEQRRAEAALRDSEQQFRDLFEHANDLVCTLDPAGRFITLNRAGETITGYSRSEALSRTLPEIATPDSKRRAIEFCERAVKNERTRDVEIDVLTRDGRVVSIEISARRLVKNDNVVGLQCIGRDVTERKLAEASLRNSISLLNSTFESTADGIVVLDLEDQLVVYNERFVEMWQIPPELLESRDVQDIRKHVMSMIEDSGPLLAKFARLSANPQATSVDLIKGRDGRYFERYSQPQFMQGKPVGRVFAYRDITERMVAEEKLRFEAHHDSLTQLPNRLEFTNLLKAAIDRAGDNNHYRFAVLFLDLDRFKVINDSLGHVVGDKLIMAVAERFVACVRPGDVVARFGGDEFTILLSRVLDEAGVRQVADRLLSVLTLPFDIDGYEVFTSASIGIVLSDEFSGSVDDFLRDADVAMYRAKEAGKARYKIFDTAIHADKMTSHQLEIDLRHAIERNELEVFYQPIVELETGSVREFEALVRWHHPARGLLTPISFIDVAEETGLIVPIGCWILEKACRQISEWRREVNFPLSVSVNLSARQLAHPALAAQVSSILAETELEPGS